MILGTGKMQPLGLVREDADTIANLEEVKLVTGQRRWLSQFDGSQKKGSDDECQHDDVEDAKMTP